jgi:hypothetical protein
MVRDGANAPPHHEGRARAWLQTLNLLSPNVRNPVKVQFERFVPALLDFWGLAAMFAQSSRSLSRHMRNKITKLLIVVVPRRTAGDG